MSMEALLMYYKNDPPSPEGGTDKGGRWYPSEEESCECCKHIRSPSRSYPWSLYKHCHSKKHLLIKLKTRPSIDEKIAMNMTIKEAALYAYKENILLKEVAKIMLEHGI